MQQLSPWLAFLFCLALPVLGWSATRPPADAVLIRQFSQQRATLDQLVIEAQRDRRDFYIGAAGTLWPHDLAERRIDEERIAVYQALLRQARVSSLSRSAQSDVVAFQVYQLLPLGPTKSYLYSPERPPTLTHGATETYRFAPGAFKHVCRPLAPDWYLCLDHED